MKEELIEYKSESFLANPTQKDKLLNKGSQNGLNWECNFSVGLSMTSVALEECVYLNWKFNWDELKDQGIEGFKGQLHLHLGYNRTDRVTYDIELTESGQVIEKKTDVLEKIGLLRMKFDLELTPIRSFTEFSPYEELFQQTEITDVALIVEGKKIYANKGLLMVYSKYFQKLFRSDLKEIATGEVPIENVRYDDFARLLSIINPRPAFPTDESAARLLDLADRFMMPAVTKHVEQRILLGSELQFTRILMLADRYGMDKLLDKCMKLVTTSLHVKNIRSSPSYEELSDRTKFKLFDLICSFT